MPELALWDRPGQERSCVEETGRTGRVWTSRDRTGLNWTGRCCEFFGLSNIWAGFRQGMDRTGASLLYTCPVGEPGLGATLARFDCPRRSLSLLTNQSIRGIIPWTVLGTSSHAASGGLLAQIDRLRVHMLIPNVLAEKS